MAVSAKAPSHVAVSAKGQPQEVAASAKGQSQVAQGQQVDEPVTPQEDAIKADRVAELEAQLAAMKECMASTIKK